MMIFVNLPVADLKKSVAFYEAIGFKNNPQFSDQTAACMVVSETIHVMLLTHEKWRMFTSKPIVDAHSQAQVLNALSVENKKAVVDMVEAAVAAGGKGDPTPVQDLDFMYGRSFEDLEGHIWEVFFMDMAALEDTGAA